VLGVLRRSALVGLLLLVSRWQDTGVSSGIDLHGTEIYSFVVERCKDLISNLQRAVAAKAGESEPAPDAQRGKTSLYIPAKPDLAGPKAFDFGYLPALPEPRPPERFSKNHFLAESSMIRQSNSMPHLFSGGDVQLWMQNDRHLRQLSDAELRALKSLRRPDSRIERVLQAVAVLRGQWDQLLEGNAAARWGHCQNVLKSQTFRTELLLLDAKQIPLQSANSAVKLLDGLSAEEVRRINPGVGALFEWAQSIARWRLEGGPPLKPSSSEGRRVPHSGGLRPGSRGGPLQACGAASAYGRRFPATASLSGCRGLAGAAPRTRQIM